MKRKEYSRYIPLRRKLKPKIESSMLTVSVENVHVYNDVNGNTHLIVYPDHIVVDSKDLISMIENKNDYLAVNEYMNIQLKDVLKAVHTFSVSNVDSMDLPNKPLQFYCLSSNNAKRPTNAFILFNNTFRKRIKSLFPNFTNSEISKFIGAMWKAIAENVKEDYINQAIECRRLHKLKYPNFEYNLGRATNSNSVSTQEMISNDWENYFDWCIQNTTSEATSGNLYCNTLPEMHFPNNEANASDQNLKIDLPTEGHGVSEWADVYNVISQFFPEETDQANYIDEQLWDILNNLTIPNTADSDLHSL